MRLSPADLVDDILAHAAARVLASPRFAGQQISPADFAADNRVLLLRDVVAQVPQMRTELAAKHIDDLDGQPEALQALLGDDTTTAERAAVVLAEPRRVRAMTRATMKKAACATANSPAGVAEDGTCMPVSTPDTGQLSIKERQIKNLTKKLDEARKRLDVANGRVEYRDVEIRALKAQLATLTSDLEDAQSVTSALRSKLAAEREAGRALAGDVTAAAVLLAAAAASPAVAEPEFDPREQDRLGRALPRDQQAPASSDGDVSADPRIAAAVVDAGLDIEVFRRALRTVGCPPQVATPELTARDISLTPLGGGTEIGGSCMLVSVGDVRILVDAGMRMKQRIDRAGPRGIDVVERGGRLDAIVITHAHHDHAGYVPALTGRFPNTPVLCTAETRALLPVMWNDSVKVFRDSRSDHVPAAEPPAEPPYGEAEVQAALRRVEAVSLRRRVPVRDGVTVELFPAGHILGAAGVVVSAGASRVTVTGDVSMPGQATVGGMVVPDSARGCDLLVIESTYCGHYGRNRDHEVNDFVARVAATVEHGRVLVPAFALGRAQEVALILRDQLPDVPVLVDGMAREVCRVYEEQTVDAVRPLEIFGGPVRAVRPQMRATEMSSFRRGVIITTSGMLSAGPAVQWARKILPDPNSALLLCGYQDEDSPGRELLDLADCGGVFQINGDEVPVHAEVKMFGLSAHADRCGLTDIIKQVAPAQVMLVHGDKHKQREYGHHLRRLRYEVAETRHWQT